MKTVFITGCSTGIGRETALLFQERGWNVAAGVREPGRAQELADRKRIACYRIDVTDRESVREAVALVVRDFGGIDVLVNNAGVYTTKPLEVVDDDELARIVDTNVGGTVAVTRAVLPLFRKQRHGTIINVSSVAGRTTFPFQALYHGTKWAIEGFSESLAYELRGFGVKVRLVEPGMVKTNLYDATLGLTGADYPEEYRRGFSRWHRFLTRNYRAGYDPRRDARTIYRAATDRGGRLRYTTDAATRLLLFLRAALPFPILTRLVAAMSGV